VRSGLYTGVGQLGLALAAAGAGAYLANRFGRNADTDGFLAAYAVYTLIVLAAQSLRLILVPELTRAAEEGRLGGELRAYATAFVAFAVPVSVLVGVFRHPIGELVTGSLPARSADVAAKALVVLVPAAFAWLLAGLAASGLAALDSYGSAAFGFGISGLVGLAVFVGLAGSVGIVALAWGLVVNGAIALAVPLVALLRRGALAGPRAPRLDVGGRLWRVLEGVAVPLALQAAYLVELRLSAGTGVGSVTSVTYAFLAATTLVGATGFALGVVSSAPLTRRGVDVAAAGRHVVHAAWVSLAFVGAAAGVCAIVGGRLVHAILGDDYAGGVGRDLGLLVVWLSPWMIGWIGFAVTYPIVFVAAKRRWILPVAAAGIVASVGFGLVFRAAWGLTGVALALGASTVLVALLLLAAVGRRTLEIGSFGVARAALALGAACALAFGPISLALPAVPSAVVGLAVYGALVLALRSQGLGEAWVYVRGLQ
jgi:O-antigen/teichoic acid export membrane protein